MDELPPRLTDDGGPTGGTDTGRRSPASRGIPIAIGVLLGAAAIVAAVLLLRGGGEAAPGTAPATTRVEPELKIIFPEGFTRVQMAERIGAVNEIAVKQRKLEPVLSPEEYLVETRKSELPSEFGAGKKRSSLEGFLFPATYEFTEATTSRQLVDKQLAAFEKAWGKVDLSYAKERNLTPYDVLIIASMIEGEVRVPRERELVAAVIYNRLRAGMPLGIDATLRYGLDIPPDESISQSDLESKGPYNTRIRPGLPPTPINNPGLAAMEAAARPAAVDYLYYARKKDCKSHFFTASADEFFSFLEGRRC
jgi:uncharacterized YceG family protein